MKPFVAVFLLGAVVLGCAVPPAMRPPAVVDPQCTSWVADCLHLGMLAETADDVSPWRFQATRRMENRLQDRAVRLKATHIIWLHRSPSSAAAEVFRCPAP